MNPYNDRYDQTMVPMSWVLHEREVIDSLERKGAVKRIGEKIAVMPGVPWPNVLDAG